VSNRRFQPGEEVVVRYLTRIGGGVGMTWPYRVVRDDDELVALYIPTGTTFMRWDMSTPGRRELVEGQWRRDVLRLMYPGKGYSIWLFWEGEGRPFTTYYVNFEEPFRRTAVGFDTNDHTLDIMVAPDLSWKWKDREEFDALLANGTFSREFGRSVEEAAAEVLALIQHRRPPFSGEWPEWTPPADWTRPGLHPRWREEPPVTWDRRAWAYPLADSIG
jgi:predicted RNA-binding protein associated with RNAse of E/G family